MHEGARLGLGAGARLVARTLSGHPARTALTLASVVSAVAALTFLGALYEGWLSGLESGFALARLGHVQVHAGGFESTQTLARALTDPAAVVREAERDPGVAATSRRVRVSGLAASSGGSAGVQVLAVDPEEEPRVTRMSGCLAAGQWLERRIPGGAILGHTLAESLGAELGDRVVLTAQRPDGGMASEVFRLQGALCPGSPEADRTLVVIGLPCAQRWLGLGTAVTDVAVRAVRHQDATAVRDRLAGILPEGEFEVMTWYDLDPLARQWLRFSQAYGLVVTLIVTALVVTQVLNTLLMALHERTPEVGLLGALGLRSRQVFGLVLLEGFALVGLGGVGGVAAGLGAVACFATGGIDLSAFTDALGLFHLSPVVRPAVGPVTGAVVLLAVAAATLLAAAYPAWKASRIDPVSAVRGL
jgi:ABC-type lipoprotein release transport system permease subunit